MEKTNKNERSCGSCKEFLNAIGVGSVVSAIRDASRGRQRPVPATVVPATAAASATNPNPATKIAEPSIGPDKTGQNGEKKVEIQVQNVEHKTGVDIEDRIAEFLRRTRDKMRTFSDIGGKNTLLRKESSKNPNTEYISRAKNKLRIASSSGVAKNSASK